MDVLSDILTSVRLGGAMIGTASLQRPWGIGVDPVRNATIHVVQEGACWLRLADTTEPIRVSKGDVILVASGVGHALADPSDAPISSIREVLSTRSGKESLPSTNEVTRLLCARYLLDGAGPHPMVALLPPLIHLTRAQIEANESLRLALELLRVEAGDKLTGCDVVVPRLLDSVLVLLLRAWIENQRPGATGWFGALRDKGIARALRLIHERPAYPWTVASLAGGASQSRATFARRFSHFLGEPPLTYVARWRMNLAAKALRGSNRTIEEIARAVGYESGPGFSKAFARLMGQTPGQYRSSFRPPDDSETS